MIQPCMPQDLCSSPETHRFLFRLDTPTQLPRSNIDNRHNEYTSEKASSRHTTCLHFAPWLPRISKQNHLLPLLQKFPTIQAAAEPLLLPPGAPAELLEEEEALAVVENYLNASGALPVACLLWPVLLVERLGRRYEATIACHPMMPAQQRHTHHAYVFV